ncbi:MAG: hypothetical protein ACLP7Q_01795 [Isosphaeraceae bacterium]
MATVTVSKTTFVKEFLHDHPEGNTKAVNEAWKAAGMEGAISHPIISEVRKQLGLTGNRPGKPIKPAKKATAKTNEQAAPTSAPGKTSFVKQYIAEHPEGTSKSVIAAWKAAGFDGTISPTLFNKTRVKLTGVRRGKTRTAPQAKAAASKPKEATGTLGKTSFVKEFLNDNPRGNVRAVNEAWTKAGMSGTISTALVGKMRSDLGLTGNGRGKSKTAPKATTTGKKRGRPRKDASVPVTVLPVAQPRGSKSDRTHALLGVEAEIDRLLFQVMGIGELPEIEAALRQVRRLVYSALSS